jgi:hypothetical protein
MCPLNYRYPDCYWDRSLLCGAGFNNGSGVLPHQTFVDNGTGFRLEPHNCTADEFPEAAEEHDALAYARQHGLDPASRFVPCPPPSPPPNNTNLTDVCTIGVNSTLNATANCTPGTVQPIPAESVALAALAAAVSFLWSLLGLVASACYKRVSCCTLVARYVLLHMVPPICSASARHVLLYIVPPSIYSTSFYI